LPTRICLNIPFPLELIRTASHIKSMGSARKKSRVAEKNTSSRRFITAYALFDFFAFFPLMTKYISVDFIVDYRREEEVLPQPSSIIKLGSKGQVKVIR
jgi:hypothetical protein